MKNNFFDNSIDETSFKLLLEEINNSKVGFYSVGLYPASLAYNCAMHSDSLNLVLAPRKGRDLLGAFSDDILSKMDPRIIKKIRRMGTYNEGDKLIPNNLSYLILNCNLVILAANSNHIQKDIYEAIKLRKSLKRENVVLACLVGSFCQDKEKDKPFILCEKYPELAFFTGFHRHGALRNYEDSFTANFCHPNSITALIGAKILNKLSSKIQVSPGVHNIECQYIKAIKNVSSIFSGFVNKFHADKPGMLPTINTVLLSQCFDQAASVSSFVRKEKEINIKNFSLKELGYGVEMIKAEEYINGKNFEIRNHTFSQLNAVTADVLGSMSLPFEGNPTRNFQAGQVLSDMLTEIKRCPKDIVEFIEWCKKNTLNQGGLEGVKSLKSWPYIFKEYGIKNFNSSMINLIYLCFYANQEEKKDIYEVLINPQELTNYCQESVRPNQSLELKYKLQGVDVFRNIELLLENLSNLNIRIDKEKELLSKTDVGDYPKYVKVIKIVNKYFSQQ